MCVKWSIAIADTRERNRDKDHLRRNARHAPQALAYCGRLCIFCLWGVVVKSGSTRIIESSKKKLTLALSNRGDTAPSFAGAGDCAASVRVVATGGAEDPWAGCACPTARARDRVFLPIPVAACRGGPPRLRLLPLARGLLPRYSPGTTKGGCPSSAAMPYGTVHALSLARYPRRCVGLYSLDMGSVHGEYAWSGFEYPSVIGGAVASGLQEAGGPEAGRSFGKTLVWLAVVHWTTCWDAKELVAVGGPSV